MMYRELLTLRCPVEGRSRKCWPQILQVSKAIYAEAEEILYGDNDFQVTITGANRLPDLVTRRQYALRLACNGNGFHNGYCPPCGHYPQWPDYLRRVLHLKLCLGIDRHSTRPRGSQQCMFEVVQKQLHRLSSMLGAEGRLKKIEVEVHAIPTEAFLAAAESILWPLVKLSSPIVLSITGISEEHRLFLTNQATLRARPAIDIFEKALQLQRIAREVMVIMDEVNHDEYITNGPQSRKIITNSLSDIETILRTGGYMDDSTDAWLAWCMKDLEDQLTARFIKEVEDQAEDKISVLHSLLVGRDRR